MSFKSKILVSLQQRVEKLQCVRNKILSQIEPDSSLQGNKSTRKILIACSHFWPSIGGLENRVELFSTELVRAGYDVSIMTLEYPGRDSSFLLQKAAISSVDCLIDFSLLLSVIIHKPHEYKTETTLIFKDCG